MTDPIARIEEALRREAPASSDFDLNPDVVLPANRKLREAAVLVPLIRTGAGVELILTRRSSRLKHHPGQIAFPGGKVDDTDAGPVAAALREANEEIGLPREIVRTFGELGVHETVTGFRITPVVAEITGAFDPIPEAGEVDEVFTVPLAHVTNPARFSVQYRIWQGRPRYYFTVPYGPYYIWGATARILRGLAERLAS
jgi:8-oxo-dGTP pyrophosphatase MutT (NUDIX family)